MSTARPFLKWVGGKSKSVPTLLERFPKSYYPAYYEPFLGGGALFFALQPGCRAVLSDVNARLVRTYKAVRDHVDDVIVWLRESKRLHNKDHFEALRSQHHIDGDTDAAVAAWMIYLNKTCFNGLYRVNASGKFNVPFGRYTNPKICDEVNLRACSRALQGVEIHCASFEQLPYESGSVVYFDPPYMPLSKTSNFTAYDKGGFGIEQQTMLRDFAIQLKRRGVHVLISNSSAARQLYTGRGFEIEEVQAARSVNSKAGGRGKITELLIS